MDPHCITRCVAHASIIIWKKEAGGTERLKVILHPWLGYRTFFTKKQITTTKRPFGNVQFSLVLLRKRGRNDPLELQWLLELLRDSAAVAQKARGHDEARRT